MKWQSYQYLFPPRLVFFHPTHWYTTKQRKLRHGGHCSAIGTCAGVTRTHRLVLYCTVSTLYLPHPAVHLHRAINVLDSCVGSLPDGGRQEVHSVTLCRGDDRVELRCTDSQELARDGGHRTGPLAAFVTPTGTSHMGSSLFRKGMNSLYSGHYLASLESDTPPCC